MLPRKDQPSQATVPDPKKRRRWPWWLAGFFLVATLTVWLAPTIIAKSPLRQRVVPTVLPQLECDVHIGSASLGWFSPIELGDVVMSDSSGEPMLVVGRIRSEKSLVGLIRDTSELGRFDVVRPELTIVLREDGSNVQDALAPLLQPSDEPTAPLGVTLRVSEGRVNVSDQVNGQQLQFADVHIEIDKPLKTDQPLKATCEGTALADGQQGTVRADFSWTPQAGADGDSFGSGEANLVLDKFALAAVQPVMDRLAPGLRLSGQMSSELACRFSGTLSQPTIQVGGWIGAGALAVDAPAWLGPDRLLTDQLAIDGQFSLSGGRFRVENGTLRSDVASLALSGSAPVSQLAEQPWSAWLTDTLESEDYRLAGEIDLARLAKMLPNTLRVREGTQITSGSVVVRSEGRLEEAGSERGRRVWTASVTTAQLAGTANGQPVTWDKPIEFSLSAHQGDQGPVVDQLSCRASFLEMTAGGTLRDAGFQVKGNFDQLTHELSRFFDLGDVKMAGTFGGELACRRDVNDTLAVGGNLVIDKLELSLPGGLALNEPRLDVGLTAAGVADDGGIQRIDQAQLTVVAGADSAEVELLRPVEQPSWDTGWPLQVRCSGELSTWLGRLRAWVPLDEWQISGRTQLAATVQASPQTISIQKGVVHLQRLHAYGPGIYVDEPDVQLDASGTWEGGSGKLALAQLTLVAKDVGRDGIQQAVVELRGEKIAAQIAESGGMDLAGEIAVRGEIARLMQWLTDPRSHSTQYVNGLVDGKANLSYSEGRVGGKCSANVSDFIYATLQTTPASPTARQPGGVAPASATAQWKPVWQEEQIGFEGQVDYDLAADLVKLQLGMTSEGFGLTIAGAIDELMSRRLADLEGVIAYDWNRVTPRLASLLGPDVVLEGREERAFFVRGPLVFSQPVAGQAGTNAQAASHTSDGSFVSTPAPPEFHWPRELAGGAGVGWSAAAIYGLTAGQVDAKAQLADGVVALTPLDVPVGVGRIRLAPRLVVRQTPMTLIVDQGRAIENVQITEPMCRTWLKYVAPALAEATRIDGRFSLDLNHARVPLPTPDLSNVSGTLHIHAARLRPGPMFDEFALLAQQIQALVNGQSLPTGHTAPQSGLVEMDPQEVPFKMANGRVYHQNLTLNVRGVRIRTSGWVGLDQTLGLIAEVPIQEDWIRQQGMLASLRGQTLQIPVRGRLDQPQLDNRVVRQLGRQIVQGAAGQLIERGLDRALEGIFRPQE
jgi:translocation and assembly module TamB